MPESRLPREEGTDGVGVLVVLVVVLVALVVLVVLVVVVVEEEGEDEEMPGVGKTLVLTSAGLFSQLLLNTY
jgi:hypothetical protein